MSGNKLAKSLSHRINGSASSIDKDYDAMFGITAPSGGDSIVELDLAALSPHPSDPFRTYSDDKLAELAESIRQFGLLEPVVVRRANNAENERFEILSGKNRCNAMRLNNSKKIKAIVRDVDDATAVMIITDANLKHRETLLPSEKGWAYRLQLEAISSQGKRRDLGLDSTSVENRQKLGRTIVADNNNVKDNEIQRYIRLTYLIADLLDRVDLKEIALTVGVELSSLDSQSQEAVLDYLRETNFQSAISVAQARAIKAVFDKDKTISKEQVREIVEGGKLKKPAKAFTISRARLKPFSAILPDDKELERLFMEFLQERLGTKP